MLNYSDYKPNQVYDAEVVVIGTGAGGAAAGAELANAGADVLFIEEGAYHAPQTFNPYVTESIPRLYRGAGTTVIQGRVPIPYAEGRCVGGSTVINGGMTWRTPERVLAEWEKMTGCEELGPKGLESYFERVEGEVYAKNHGNEAVGDHNRVMVGGAQKMGWEYQVNSRNQNLCVGTNNCIIGCPTGAKQSTLVSYMPKAIKSGARCLTQLRAEKLLIENGRCTGVICKAINPRTMRGDIEVTVRGKAVIVACGAVQTPYLLLQHKLGRRSRALGRNFTCHPNVKVMAMYPFDVRGWQGVNQYAQIREFHDEGIILAENFLPPGVVAAHLPYHGEKAWELMQRYNNMVISGVLVEDSTTGRVIRGPLGMPMPMYDVTDYDHHRFIKGARLLAEMHFAMGADTVVLPFHNFSVIHSADELKKLDPKRQKPSSVELVTVHLMGSVRMGSNERDSVLNLDGQVWDLPGCYVTDASIFPTAIGVNPQITILALSTRIAGRMIDRLGQIRRAA